MKSVFFFVLISTLALTTDLAEVRKAYRNAANNQANTIKLHKNLSAIHASDDVLLLAYKGATLTLMAKYAKGAKTKTGYFKEGKKLIEQSISAAPKNIELRYIRLSVQENAPKIVRYKKNISEDKEYILNHYSGIADAETKAYIKSFVSQSTSFSELEKQLF